MLALLIPRKEFVTRENFDVYLCPLYDVQKPLGYRSFTLRGVLLWTIHDFPGYGILIGVTH
jgi:hypothetical protein